MAIIFLAALRQETIANNFQIRKIKQSSVSIFQSLNVRDFLVRFVCTDLRAKLRLLGINWIF